MTLSLTIVPSSFARTAALATDRVIYIGVVIFFKNILVLLPAIFHLILFSHYRLRTQSSVANAIRVTIFEFYFVRTTKYAPGVSFKRSCDFEFASRTCVSASKTKRTEKRKKLRKGIGHRRSNLKVSSHLLVIRYL